MSDRKMDAWLWAGFGVLAVMLGYATVTAVVPATYWILFGITALFVLCFLAMLWNVLTS